MQTSASSGATSTGFFLSKETGSDFVINLPPQADPYIALMQFVYGFDRPVEIVEDRYQRVVRFDTTMFDV